MAGTKDLEAKEKAYIAKIQEQFRRHKFSVDERLSILEGAVLGNLNFAFSYENDTNLLSLKLNSVIITSIDLSDLEETGETIEGGEL